MKLRIGTRKSRLAMVQAEMVRDAILAKFPEAEIELAPMSTKGDQMLDRSLTSFGGKGVFTKELENALLKGRIDLAVHSAKDMPMELPKGLAVGAVLPREEAADVLLTKSGILAKELAAGSVIGTGSLRRQIQIREINPQVFIKPLRGNVQTRIRKLLDGEYDGIILAAAGLKRLNFRAQEYGLSVEYLDRERFVPAAGQGILAVETRQGELSEVMEQIHSPEAAAELLAERTFLTILGGSCNAPCGAYCRRSGGRLAMTVMYAGDGIHPCYQSGEREIVQTDVCEEDRKTAWQTQAKELAGELAARVRCHPVCLVGAGPGDAGLLSVKGLDRVRRADVIVYDDLISGSVLNEARLDAELVYVGKRRGKHSMPQEEIQALLVKCATEGKAVVRLKGGDPFVFGRGGEEALELKKHGIPYEIIPGVSSAYSVPACAGIPVTHRGLASSFHVVTGHEGAGKAQPSVDYGVLAREEGTLVFLMGLQNLREITGRLIAGGKDPATPAAVIQSGTTAGQRVLRSDLRHIAAQAESKGMRTPAITVIGPVAALHEALDWFGKGILAGKRVLVTGSRYFCREMEEALRPYGAETVAVSLIESRAVWTEKTRETFACLDQYQWLVFTSGNGVHLFFETMKQQEIDLRRIMHLKFAAIGRKTAETLAGYGFRCDFVPENFSGADLAREWIPTIREGESVLLMRAGEGSPTLPRMLSEAGIPYADVPLYETWVDTRRKEELNRQIRQADYVTVASASAARALSSMLDVPGEITAKLISIGPYTTAAAKEQGLSVYADAVEYTADGIAAVILADVEAGQCKNVPTAQPPQHQPYFPLFVDPRGRQVLIVGAGAVAARRASVLAEFGADILVVAPEGNAAVEALETEGKLRRARRPFAPEDLDGAQIVIAATDEEALNEQIVCLCREKGIPVNHAGRKEQSDFYFPAIAKEGDVVVGVTASGSDHPLVRELADDLREWLHENLERQKTDGKHFNK
ncbi:MAG: hydroxymethylbilane synthase [Clostridiales bacterium]|nr:hydroxymethylbilane synthase [Clostridiales bacterium]